jgi:uncharacterized membrane protein
MIFKYGGTMKNLRFSAKCVLMFMIGGFLYIGLEIVFRGYTHISMFLAGGLSFLFIGLINEAFPGQIALTSRMLISAFIITSIELIIGLIVNVWLKNNVWDYSNMPYNYKGQICLLFFNIWFLLSLPAIILNDWLKYFLLGEEKPKFKIL